MIAKKKVEIERIKKENHGRQHLHIGNVKQTIQEVSSGVIIPGGFTVMKMSIEFTGGAVCH